VHRDENLAWPGARRLEIGEANGPCPAMALDPGGPHRRFYFFAMVAGRIQPLP
jgi:hypothetical protein